MHSHFRAACMELKGGQAGPSCLSFPYTNHGLYCVRDSAWMVPLLMF